MGKIRGERIRSLREAMRLRQSDLAYRCDISVSYLSEIERGNRNPGADVLAALAEALDTSTDYLVGRTDDPAPPSGSRKAAGAMAFQLAPAPDEPRWTQQELEGLVRRIVQEELEKRSSDASKRQADES